MLCGPMLIVEQESCVLEQNETLGSLDILNYISTFFFYGAFKQFRSFTIKVIFLYTLVPLDSLELTVGWAFYVFTSIFRDRRGSPIYGEGVGIERESRP